MRSERNSTKMNTRKKATKKTKANGLPQCMHDLKRDPLTLRPYPDRFQLVDPDWLVHQRIRILECRRNVINLLLVEINKGNLNSPRSQQFRKAAETLDQIAETFDDASEPDMVIDDEGYEHPEAARIILDAENYWNSPMFAEGDCRGKTARRNWVKEFHNEDI